MNPPENVLVISVDEKTQIQALERTQKELSMKPRLPKRQTVTYKRHGVANLMAALAVHQGDVHAKCVESNTSVNFLIFLKEIAALYPGKELYFIADNLATHKQKDVVAWIASKPLIHMVFTPTYSSWLNQVEIWFNIMTKDVLKSAIWTSKEQLVGQIMEYIKTYNTTRAQPFTWKYAGKKTEKKEEKSVSKLI